MVSSRLSSNSCSFLLSSFSTSEPHYNSLADIAPGSVSAISSSIPVFDRDPAISPLPSSALLTSQASSSLDGLPSDLAVKIAVNPEQVVDVGGVAMAMGVHNDVGVSEDLSILQDQQLSTPTMHPNLVSTLKSIICPVSASPQQAGTQFLVQDHASEIVPDSSSAFCAASSTNVGTPQLQMLFACNESAPNGSIGVGEKNGEQKEPQHAAIVPIHLIQNRRPYRCSHNGCNKTFKNPQTLKMHHKTHCSINGGAFSSECSKEKVLHSLATVPQSGKAGLNKKIPSRCPICKRAFVGLYELRRHFGRKHSEGEKAHACNKCGKRFYIEVDLRDHQKLCGEPLSCKCGMKFAFKCNLVAHKKTHPSCQEDEHDQHSSQHGFERQSGTLTQKTRASNASDMEARTGLSKAFFLPSNLGLVSSVLAGTEVAMASTCNRQAGRVYPRTTSSHIYRPVVKSEQVTGNPWQASAVLGVSRAL